MLYTTGGDIYKRLCKYDEAVSYWNKALSISDKYCDTMFSTAFCCQKPGNYDEEIQA